MWNGTHKKEKKCAQTPGIYDQSYVKIDFEQIPGQNFYIATGRGDVPDNYKFEYAYKFVKKVMIWQGKTQSFITSSTMTSKVYKVYKLYRNGFCRSFVYADEA